MAEINNIDEQANKENNNLQLGCRRHSIKVIKEKLKADVLNGLFVQKGLHETDVLLPQLSKEDWFNNAVNQNRVVMEIIPEAYALIQV